jgi:hypothetical protein
MSIQIQGQSFQKKKSGDNKALLYRLTAVAKLMFCLPPEGKTLCPSSGRHVAEVHEVFPA